MSGRREKKKFRHVILNGLYCLLSLRHHLPWKLWKQQHWNLLSTLLQLLRLWSSGSSCFVMPLVLKVFLNTACSTWNLLHKWTKTTKLATLLFSVSESNTFQSRWTRHPQQFKVSSRSCTIQNFFGRHVDLKLLGLLTIINTQSCWFDSLGMQTYFRLLLTVKRRTDRNTSAFPGPHTNWRNMSNSKGQTCLAA